MLSLTFYLVETRSKKKVKVREIMAIIAINMSKTSIVDYSYSINYVVSIKRVT